MIWLRVKKSLTSSPYSLKLLLVGIAYYLGAHLSLYLSFPESNVGVLSPASAVLLTTLLLSPRRQWLGYLLIAVPSQLLAELPMGVSLLQGVTSVVAVSAESLLAATLILGLLSESPRFDRLYEMLVFLVSAVLVGPLVAGLVWAAGMTQGIGGGDCWECVRTWVLSDALTHMSITPLLVLVFGPTTEDAGRKDVGWIERGAVLAGVCTAGYMLFRYDVSKGDMHHAFFYIPVPMLIWSAVRFGLIGCFSSCMTVCLIAVWCASHGQGPFVFVSDVSAITDLQILLLLCISPIVLLATSNAEHRKARKSLRESEEKYRLLVDNAGDMVVEVDREGRFLYVSPEYCRVFGKSEEELLGQAFMPLVHEDDRVATERAMASLVVPPYVCYVEQRAMTCKGWRWIAWRDKALLDEKGRVEAVVGVGRDIQALKEAEAEHTRLHDRLSRAEKRDALNLLAGGVAHDLNNILSGIISFPDLLLLDLPEESDMREPLEMIRESGLRAAAVVKDMAGLSRLTDRAVRLIPANVSRIMSEYMASSEYKDVKRRHPDVDVVVDLDPGVLSISCSPIQLRRVIENLVLNALEISSPDGRTLIRTQNRYFEEPVTAYEEIPSGEYVVLEVSDSGAQVMKKDLSRIFDPYFTRKTLGWGGTGLGLTLVWNVVHDCGGFVDVVSSEQGTTFTLYFPATRVSVTDPEVVESVVNYRGNGEYILVVDDEKAQRTIARHILERLNYRVDAEASGEAAVEFLATHVVDLVLLDMVMPNGMGGEETYRKLSVQQPGLKAVVASGFAHADSVQAMREAGVTRYIEKPYTIARLARAVYDELHAKSAAR